MLPILDTPAVRHQALPISVAHYHLLCANDPQLRKTELINGVILEKMSKSPLHTWLLNTLYAFFAEHVPTGCLLRKEDPLTLNDSEPEPDLAIVKGALADFKTSHPQQALLVVEVAVSSLELDRAKASMYAAANVPEYWIVVADEQVIETHTQPVAGRYTLVQRFDQGSVVQAGFGVELLVSTLFQER